MKKKKRKGNIIKRLITKEYNEYKQEWVMIILLGLCTFILIGIKSSVLSVVIFIGIIMILILLVEGRRYLLKHRPEDFEDDEEEFY